MLTSTSYPAYNPAEHSEGLHHPDTPCLLAFQDRGIAAIIQSANRENAAETAMAVYGITHPPIVLVARHGGTVPTISN